MCLAWIIEADFSWDGFTKVLMTLPGSSMLSVGKITAKVGNRSTARKILRNFLNLDLDQAAESPDFARATQAANILMTNEKLPAEQATFLADFSDRANSIFHQFRSARREQEDFNQQIMAYETEEKSLTEEGQRYVERKNKVDQEVADLEASFRC